jgi:long-subunit acyl-CoA synthetase (AMP-forming)
VGTDGTAPATDPPPSCLAEVFVRAVERAPDRTCLHRRIDEQSSRASYLEVARRVASIIDSLDRLGLRAGHRVVTFLDEIHDAVHFALACAHTQITAVPLDPRFSPAALRRLIERTDAAAVFTRVEHLGACDGLAVPALVLRAGPAPARAHDLWTDELPDPDAALATLRARTAGPDSVYVIQPTSGTTGEPKLMLRTQRPFLRIGRLWRFAHVDPPDHQRRIVVNPLTHGAGVLDLWAGLAAGAELCMPSRPNVEAPLAEVRALDPHVLVMVPRILRALRRQQLAAGEPPGARLFGPSARVLAFGGAPCEPELQELLLEQGVEVVEIYGTSETGILVMTPPGARRPGWAGRPFDDALLKLDEDGELLARTPCMMEGYLGAEELTRESYDHEGYYRTGDYAEIDGDGWVRVLGRKKDVFNTPTGNNLYPARLEGMLEQLAGVEQAVVIGEGRPYLTALVVLGADRGRLAEVAAQVRTLNARLEGEERVRRLHALDAPIGAELYRPVGHGKVRRERKLIEERYQPAVEALYRDPAPAEVWVVE